MKLDGLKVFAVLGVLAVILGAFGAHGLKPRVPDATLEAYKTGVLYHLIHTIVIGIVALAGRLDYISKSHRLINVFLIGILLFSGSLYLITFGSAMQTDMRIIGPITPIGGVVLIIAWVYTFLNIKKQNLPS